MKLTPDEKTSVIIASAIILMNPTIDTLTAEQKETLAAEVPCLLNIIVRSTGFLLKKQ